MGLTRSTWTDDDGTGTTGTVLNAAALTAIYDAIESWTWTTYTPSWTNLAVGNGTVTAKYFKVGKLVHYQIQLTFGNSTSVSGAITFSLPVAAPAYAAPGHYGIATFYDSGVGISSGKVYMNASATTGVLYTTGNPDVVTSATAPFTWTTADQIWITGTYEAA